MQSKMKESDPILEVENLSATTDNLPILKGVSLTVYPGEIHALWEEMDVAKVLFRKSLQDTRRIILQMATLNF